MASTINNLYLKYCNRVQRFLENDGYYQYLLELIANGKPTITQYNRVLDKTVDEKWLTAIEDAIPAIHEIIAHPRRFLKTVEEIQPVEKVKKIGPSTVQHLSSHTQYITGMRGGTIYPGKLLTVENEESIDLYENRFVNTLIRKLSEFIEKRTGALFWDTGDEEQSLLRMESTVEDDYEIIDYKLELTVHNKQTYLENDAGKLEVFKRIDRVRRVIADFRQSAFVAAMAGTSAVRSPIQRTNQLVKNPEYRKCYDLWQFLERYDQVGYDIDVRETALDFDEDYLFQMYGNLALNYTVFKSLLEKDQRRVTETPKRRKTVKPKFVKQIVEEFVDDYDIPDVEVRKVIIEEVVKAQAEIERRTEALKHSDAAKEREKLAKEKEREKARLAKEKEREKARIAKEKEKEREKAQLAKEKEREKARIAKEKEKEREKARLAKEKEREKARIAKEKEKEREKARLAKEKEREKARIAKEKEKEREKARLAKEKEREKARIAKEKEKEREKARLAKEKEQEKARIAKEKESAKAAAPKPTAKPKPKKPAPAPDSTPPAPPAPAPTIPEEPSAAPPPAEEVPPSPQPEPEDSPAEADLPGGPSPVPPSPAPADPEALRPEAGPVAPTPAPAEESTPPARPSTGNPVLDWINRRRKRDR